MKNSITQNVMNWLYAFLLFAFCSQAMGHARITTPTPRNNGDNNKNELSPCGPGARGTPHVYLPGQTIKVDWEETINHSGYFEFFFSEANDQNFQSLLMVQDDKGALVGGVSNKFTANITLPNIECAACTLRMIQFMSDNPAFPYQSCIDIALSATAPPPTNPPPGGATGLDDTSTPSPSGEKPGFGCGQSENVKSSGLSNWTGILIILMPLFITLTRKLQWRKFKK